jgi:hypothetical protein
MKTYENTNVIKTMTYECVSYVSYAFPTLVHTRRRNRNYI